MNTGVFDVHSWHLGCKWIQFLHSVEDEVRMEDTFPSLNERIENGVNPSHGSSQTRDSSVVADHHSTLTAAEGDVYHYHDGHYCSYCVDQTLIVDGSSVQVMIVDHTSFQNPFCTNQDSRMDSVRTWWRYLKNPSEILVQEQSESWTMDGGVHCWANGSFHVLHLPSLTVNGIHSLNVVVPGGAKKNVAAIGGHCNDCWIHSKWSGSDCDSGIVSSHCWILLGTEKNDPSIEHACSCSVFQPWRNCSSCDGSRCDDDWTLMAMLPSMTCGRRIPWLYSCSCPHFHSEVRRRWMMILKRTKLILNHYHWIHHYCHWRMCCHRTGHKWIHSHQCDNSLPLDRSTGSVHSEKLSSVLGCPVHRFFLPWQARDPFCGWSECIGTLTPSLVDLETSGSHSDPQDNSLSLLEISPVGPVTICLNATLVGWTKNWPLILFQTSYSLPSILRFQPLIHSAVDPLLPNVCVWLNSISYGYVSIERKEEIERWVEKGKRKELEREDTKEEKETQWVTQSQ